MVCLSESELEGSALGIRSSQRRLLWRTLFRRFLGSESLTSTPTPSAPFDLQPLRQLLRPGTMATENHTSDTQRPITSSVSKLLKSMPDHLHSPRAPPIASNHLHHLGYISEISTITSNTLLNSPESRSWKGLVPASTYSAKRLFESAMFSFCPLKTLSSITSSLCPLAPS